VFFFVFFFSLIFYVKKISDFFPQISAKLVEFVLGKYIFHNNSSKTSVQKIINPSTKKKKKKKTVAFIFFFLLLKRHIFYTLKYVFPMIFFQKSSQMKKKNCHQKNH
jgi:hypothetical protein